MRRVRAIKYTQNSRVFYAAVITAGDLVEMTKVDVWHSDQAPDDQGYQRVPNRSRIVTEVSLSHGRLFLQ